MGKVDDDLHTRRSKGPMAAQTSRGRDVKRPPASQSRIPSPPTNRPRTTLPDLTAYCSSSPWIPTWGSKRALTAIGDPWWLPVLPPSPTDPISSPSSSRDWANLTDGPAALIAERLLADDVVDYVSFRATCRPWRLCCTDPREHGVLDDRRFHPRQWVMLRTEGGRRYRRRFMNVTTGACIYVGLPELRGHDVFGLTTEGLLVLLRRSTYVVRLLNPFTGQATAVLPSATTVMSQWHLVTRRRDSSSSREKFVEISGAGLAAADGTTVAVHFVDLGTVAVAKPGDAHWRVVLVPGGIRDSHISQAMSFAGKFYCVTRVAVMVVEIRADQPPFLAMVAKLPRRLSEGTKDTVHLVDNGGELTLVERIGSRQRRREYEVYRVDMDARKVVHVRGLGGRAAFVGWERALSVSPSVFPSVSGDTIYLGYDKC